MQLRMKKNFAVGKPSKRKLSSAKLKKRKIANYEPALMQDDQIVYNIDANG